MSKPQVFEQSMFLFMCGKQDHRVRYNQENYSRVFGDNPVEFERLQKSEEEPSLSE